MTLPSRDHAYLEGVSTDQLAALLLELASQLHVERQRRMAMETLLQRQGLIDNAALDGLTRDPVFTSDTADALDTSLRRLFRVMSEQGDPRGPLRREAI